jgi:hypothetical protein
MHQMADLSHLSHLTYLAHLTYLTHLVQLIHLAHVTAACTSQQGPLFLHPAAVGAWNCQHFPLPQRQQSLTVCGTPLLSCPQQQLGQPNPYVLACWYRQ